MGPLLGDFGEGLGLTGVSARVLWSPAGRTGSCSFAARTVAGSG